VLALVRGARVPERPAVVVTEARGVGRNDAEAVLAGAHAAHHRLGQEILSALPRARVEHPRRLVGEGRAGEREHDGQHGQGRAHLTIRSYATTAAKANAGADILDRPEARWYAAHVTAAGAPKGRRPIVPFLRLPADGPPHLVGQRCSGCGAVYLGRRRACSRCAGEGPFEEIPLSPRGELYVWSIVHQSMPRVPVPYV